MYFFCQCLIYVLNHELSTIVNNVFMLLLRLIKKKVYFVITESLFGTLIHVNLLDELKRDQNYTWSVM